MGVTTLAAATGFVFLYTLHGLTLDPAGVRSSAAVAGASVSTAIANTAFFPQRDTLLATLVWDLPFWVLWLWGCGILMQRIRATTATERARWVEVAGLALPVVSVVVYRNSFPYFYSTILAPASVLLALAWPRLMGRGIAVTLCWFAASVLVHGLYVPITMPLEQQRAVLAMVHRAFPRPVSYLDRCSVLASFPQAGFFMTTWALHAYLQEGRPRLLEAISEKAPPLLIANHPLLNPDHVVYPASPKDSLSLLPEDRQALAGAYIHHWGPVYVAGKRLRPSSAGDTDPVRFDLLIAGRYTLEASGPATIDGQAVTPGRTIDLRRGRHQAVLPSAEPATLRWGEALYRPVEAPPPQEFFLGF